MNFYVDSGGAILGVDPEKIYQGSANANTIRFVGAFASNVKVTVAFKLPTGVWTTPQLMTASTQLAGVVTSNGAQFNVWEYSVPALVTETFGTVNMQFFVYGDAGNGNGGLIATASSSFQVERGVPITLPDPTDDYETLLTQILSALSQIEGQIPGMEEDITGLQSKVSDLSENKLDKVSGNTTYKQAYAKDTNGDQIMQNYSTENVTNAIVQRDETGNIKITPGRKGYMNDGATMRNIADVESEVAKKYDKTGGTIDGNVQITGDLNVDGTTTTNDTETLQVKDNFIVTNADGTPLNSLSGIVIRTNANTTYAIVYDPISDSVKLGEGTYTDGKFTFLEGEGEAVAVRDDSTAFTDKHVIVWDAAGDKFVDGGKAVSDLPTLAGNNDFTGENTFEEAIQAKKGTVVKNSLDETNYNAGYISRNDWTYLFPSDSGTFALTKNIPTDYATQTALANTQRQVDGLYTLLEQKNEIYVQTATDTYTTRETAGGENIADGVQTPVKKITGKTVKTTNLIPYPYADKTKTINGITFTVNTDGTITVNGTATKETYFVIGKTTLEGDSINAIGVLSATNGKYTLSNGNNISGVGLFYNSNNKTLALTVVQGATVNNLVFKPMLNYGSSALPYMPYFSGLKNAFFKKIVSTGRNLLSFPYLDGTSLTNNGVTFTTNNDGSITVNGTPTDYVAYRLISDFRGIGEFILSGIPSSANLTFTFTAYNSAGDSIGTVNGLAGQSIQFNTANYIGYDHALLQIRRSQNNELINNVTVYPMLNYGSFALPYEPYTQSVLSLPEAVELTEYDTAYPETGEIQRQSNTITFNGTKYLGDYSTSDYFIYTASLQVYGTDSYSGIANNGFVFQHTPSGNDMGVYIAGEEFSTINFWFRKTIFPELNTVDKFKAQLAEWNEAGNPLTVTYKTAEVTTEQADFSADSYIAWKNGSETIEQGDTDNSEYGAENTVEQDYYLLTAPQEVTKE